MHKSSLQQSASDENRLTGSTESVVDATVAPSARKPPFRAARVAASVRFTAEVRAIEHAAKDITNLRSLLADCLQRNQRGVSLVWFCPGNACNQILFERFADEQHASPAARRIAGQLARQALQTNKDLVVSNSDVRGCTCIALRVADVHPPESLVLIRSTLERSTIDHDTLAGQHIADAIGRWQLRQRVETSVEKLNATCAILDLVSQIENSQSIDEAARVLADLIRDYLDCSFVAVGQKGSGRLTASVTAVSGVADFDPTSTRVQRIRASLDEAIARDGPVASDGATAGLNVDQPPQGSASHAFVLPQPSGNTHSSDGRSFTVGQNLAQQRLAEQSNCQCVVSFPLHDASGAVVGAVTTGGRSSLLAPQVMHFLTAADQSVGNAFATIRRTQRSLPLRTLRRALELGRYKFYAVLGILVLAMALMWLPMPYRIACRFRCQSVERRSAVAPYDGLVKATLVRPGDVVSVGTELAVMDDRELRYELTGLVAEMERARTEQKVRLTEEKIGASLMASLEVSQVRSRRELIEHRLENLVIRSSIDGLVLSGGIDRKENYPVRIGELLYEIAPLNQIRFDIAVPAEEIGQIGVGMKVELRADRQVRELFESEIIRIRPRSETVDGDNVFIAEVEVDNTQQQLRPGMEGSARIVSAPKRLGWILFHRVYEHIVSRWRW